MTAPSETWLALPLPAPMVIEIVGGDASRVMNNLTTNDIAKLQVGQQLETFVTDLRGWTVAHGVVHRDADRLLLVGQHPEPQRVCDHIDRYIIREDARVANLSDTQRLVVADGQAAAPDGGLQQLNQQASLRRFAAPIVSASSVLWCGPAAEFEALGPPASQPTDMAEFERLRIRNFWPTMGREILDKCIPQELDRDAAAISFTKGCYLGQETIARLDARGQLQKKLCLLRFATGDVAAGSSLSRDGKEIGQVTSAAADADGQETWALAFLRRGNFAAGTQVECQGSSGLVVAVGTGG